MASLLMELLWYSIQLAILVFSPRIFWRLKKMNRFSFQIQCLWWWKCNYSLSSLGLCIFIGIWTSKGVLCWVSTRGVTAWGGSWHGECNDLGDKSQRKKLSGLPALLSGEVTEAANCLLLGEEVVEWRSRRSFPSAQSTSQWQYEMLNASL